MGESPDQLYLDVRKTLINGGLLPPGAGIVAGVSGGPDSICLLHILVRCFNKGVDGDSESGATKPERLVTVHVNHMLRGEEAARDEAHVVRVCAELGVRLVCVKADVPSHAAAKKISIEAAGHELRFEALEREREALEAETGRIWRIAVAHNRDDLAETVLMNIIRGAGANGLGGMSALSGNANVIRPLLGAPRSQIIRYLNHHRVQTVVDSTNDDVSYMRNRIRNNLLPLLRKEYNPGITDAFCRLSEAAAKDADYLNSVAESEFAACIDMAQQAQSYGNAQTGNTTQADAATQVDRDQRANNVSRAIFISRAKFISLSLSRFSSLHPAIAARVARFAAAAAGADVRAIGSAHIADLLALACAGRTGAQLHLPGGLRVRRRYDTIDFFRITDSGPAIPREPPIASEHPIARGPATPREPPGYVIKSLHKKDKEVIERIRNIRYNSYEQYFDADLLCSDDLVLRCRQCGDFFFPIKSPGQKKLKDYFIDAKIPVEMRDSICVLAVGREIVWVIGYRAGERYKVTDQTQNILKVRYITSGDDN